MEAKKLAGYALILLPFIGVFLGGLHMIGLKGIVVVFAMTGSTVACIWGGACLIEAAADPSQQCRQPDRLSGAESGTESGTESGAQADKQPGRD